VFGANDNSARPAGQLRARSARAVDLDNDFHLHLDVARLLAYGGPQALADLLIELGCRRMVRTEIDCLLAEFVLVTGPSGGLGMSAPSVYGVRAAHPEALQ
jgi:hypothetical protein